jgi:hypothetical protein
MQFSERLTEFWKCYSSMENKIVRACSIQGWIGSMYKILVGKPGGKRSLGRHKYRWEYNIKMHLTEIGWEDVYWIHQAQDRDHWQDLLNTVMNIQGSYRWGIS